MSEIKEELVIWFCSNKIPNRTFMLRYKGDLLPVDTDDVIEMIINDVDEDIQREIKDFLQQERTVKQIHDFLKGLMIGFLGENNVKLVKENTRNPFKPLLNLFSQK